MPLYYGSTKIDTVVYNNKEIDDLYYNNTLVFSKPRELIVIGKDTPGYGGSGLSEGIPFDDGGTGSLQDSKHILDSWPTPKTIDIDCTPYNTLEVVVRGRINESWLPNSVNWSQLYCGLCDTDKRTDWGSDLPYITLIVGNATPHWNGEDVDYRITGGALTNEYGDWTGDYKTVSCDISAVTGVHKFRVWAHFDNLNICRVSWWTWVKSVRVYR